MDDKGQIEKEWNHAMAEEIDARQKYWEMAGRAIASGKLTKEEARIIARVGGRKERYWKRHLRDLVTILKERRQRACKDGGST